MRESFINDQFEMLSRNFAKNWITPERQNEIVDHADKIGISEPAFQRAIEHFVKTDERPGVITIKMRMNIELERAKTFGAIKKENGFCSICDGNSFVWVKDDEKLLVMNCLGCQGSDDHTPIRDIPYYDGSLTIIESPVLKAIKKLSPEEKERYAKDKKGEMSKILSKVQKAFAFSRGHFRLKAYAEAKKVE